MLTIYLNPNSKKPMYVQIYEYIKNEIKRGNLMPEDKLPSARKLATNLSISRITVDAAYSQLVSEGYVLSYPKRGYFVAEIDKLLNMAPIAHPPIMMEEIGEKPDYKYDFTPVGHELDNFPANIWRRLSREILSYDEGLIFKDSDPKGSYKLRRELVRYLRESRGILTDEDHIILGAGSQYLMMLLFKIINKPLKVAMENPAYIPAYKTLKTINIEVVPTNVDGNGINVDELFDSDVSIAYVTPSHQFPTGSIMPVANRAKLLNWANYQPGRYIIEDDYDSEFRYKGRPIPSLLSMDKSSRVIYMGTFSKVISSAIRMSYMVLPDELMNKYTENFSNIGSTVSKLDMAIMTEFMSGGYLERHINRIRNKYSLRHSRMISELKKLGDKVIIKGSNAGSSLLLEWRGEMGEEELVKAADEAGVKMYPLSSYLIGSYLIMYPTFVMGFSSLNEDAIGEAVSILGEKWR